MNMNLTISYKVEGSNVIYDFIFTNPDNSHDNFKNQHNLLLKSLETKGVTSNNQNFYHLYNSELNKYIMTTNELLNCK